MAKVRKTPKEKASPPEKKTNGLGRPRRTVEKPVSLYPLEFEEAVDALLQVKIEPEKKKSRAP